ncbi:MAG: MotA/TolQ/ExbB proton channel family protein [Pseudomonadota bacterium]
MSGSEGGLLAQVLGLGAGGYVLIVLGFLSLLSITLIIVKLFQLWGARPQPYRLKNAIARWQGGNRTEAQAIMHGGSAPADRVVCEALKGLDTGTDSRTLEAELTTLGNEEVVSMNRFIRLLELIAMVSPLLGLLGTVLGMIQSFQELELAEGAANASVLAGGIWQALLTTAAGLIVAIPAAVAASLFSARVETAAQDIENSVGRVLALEGEG